MTTRGKYRFIIILIAAAAAISALYMTADQNKEVKIMGNLAIASSAFENGGMIPKAYTEKGDDKSPPLRISGVDPRAKSLALIVDDPDIPIPFLSFTHWVVYNIPADIAEIAEGMPHGEVIAALGGAFQGKNGFGRIAYIGPNPPFGTHTYRFMLYTLDTVLDLKPGAGRKQVEKAMDGHVLQTGLLTGKYGK